MMEGLLRQRLAQHADIQVTSAGTAALVDRPAEPFAVEIMAERGIDISSHRARQVDEPTLYNADLVFVMERSHLNWIEANFPAVRGRMFLVGHWQKSKEVPDPFMAPKSMFEDVYHQLSDCVDDCMSKLRLAVHS